MSSANTFSNKYADTAPAALAPTDGAFHFSIPENEHVPLKGDCEGEREQLIFSLATRAQRSVLIDPLRKVLAVRPLAESYRRRASARLRVVAVDGQRPASGSSL